MDWVSRHVTMESRINRFIKNWKSEKARITVINGRFSLFAKALVFRKYRKWQTATPPFF
jgi:hypothetical protein